MFGRSRKKEIQLAHETELETVRAENTQLRIKLNEKNRTVQKYTMKCNTLEMDKELATRKNTRQGNQITALVASNQNLDRLLAVAKDKPGKEVVVYKTPKTKDNLIARQAGEIKNFKSLVRQLKEMLGAGGTRRIETGLKYTGNVTGKATAQRTGADYIAVFKALRDQKWLRYDEDRHMVPYASRGKSGYFHVYAGPYGSQTRFTPKGQKWLIEKFIPNM